MRFLKRNFILIFLIASAIAMGVLAFVTALRLREFNQTPTEVSALTPTCKLSFVVTDATPREISVTPTPPLFVQAKLTPTVTVMPTLTSTVKPTITTKPTATMTPAPTKTLGGAGTTTPTITPKATPTSTYLAKGATTPTPLKTTTPIPTKSVTPTIIAQPNLPVSGTSLPTLGAFLLGIILLGVGIFSGRFLFLSGK